jgi:hypothetical protein
VSHQEARKIRADVAASLGGYFRSWSHREIISSVQWSKDLNPQDPKFSQRVSSALGWWLETGSVVGGYRLLNLAGEGANRKYQLEEVPIAAPAETTATVTQLTETMHVLRRTGDKVALMDDDGEIWVAKKVPGL